MSRPATTDLKKCCITSVFDSSGYLKKDKFKKLKATMLLGVAGLMNLEIAAKFHDSLTHLVLFDFDEKLAGENGFWHVFSEVIKNSSTKEVFLQNLRRQLIECNFFDINALHSQASSQTIHRRKILTVESSADFILDQIKKMKWFKSDSKFAYIKNLFSRTEEKFEQEGGVKILQLDLSKAEDLEKLVKFSKMDADQKGDQSSIIIHLSNSLDFVLQRGDSRWDPELASPTSGSKDVAIANAKLLRRNFLEPLKAMNVHIIDSVHTHNVILHRVSVPGDDAVEIPLHGHFHSTVATPQQIIEYRYTKPDIPGAVCAEAFKRTAKLFSSTKDEIHEVITKPRRQITFSTIKNLMNTNSRQTTI